MNAYERRAKEQQQKRLETLAKATRERRDNAMLHAHAVIRRYEDAYSLCYPDWPLPQVTYVADTGRYCMITNDRKQTVYEKTLTDATDFMYARAHEREIQTTES